MLHHARYLLVLLACVPLVTAHTAPSQDDGGSGGDAPDHCTDDLVVVNASWGFLSGNLYPPQDSKDYFGLLVDADDVNETIVVSLDGHSEMTLEVFMPDCGRNVVAQSPACAKAERCVGHANVAGPGHANCDAPGHQGDSICDTEQGERSASGDSVSFVPSQEGVYVALVSIKPSTKGGSPVDSGPSVSSCHATCMDYDLTSTSTTIALVD